MGIFEKSRGETVVDERKTVIFPSIIQFFASGERQKGRERKIVLRRSTRFLRERRRDV